MEYLQNVTTDNRAKMTQNAEKIFSNKEEIDKNTASISSSLMEIENNEANELSGMYLSMLYYYSLHSISVGHSQFKLLDFPKFFSTYQQLVSIHFYLADHLPIGVIHKLLLYEWGEWGSSNVNMTT